MAYKDKDLKLLDRKKRILMRWTIALGIVALLAFIGLGGMIIERLLKGAPGGGLEINTAKLDNKIAWLGAEIRDIDATIDEELGLSSVNGVLINDVVENSPADKAGLERGDVILVFDKIPIKDSFQIQEEILKYQPGDTVRIVVDKIDSGKKIVYLKLGTKPTGDKSSADSNIKKISGASQTMAPQLSTSWGISIAPLTEDLREQFAIPDSERGVAVVAVAKGSLADSYGIDVGDVIESINQDKTANLQSFYKAIGDEEGVMLDVYSSSDMKRFFVTFPDEGDSPPQAVLTDFSQEASKGELIVIASDSSDLDGAVFSRFSSAPYFILYDLKKSEMSIIENPYAAQVRGMGITVAQMIMQKDIDAVIVGGIGPQAFDAFYLSKIKIYGPFTGSVQNAISDYQSDKLFELKEANLGGYGFSSGASIRTGSSPWTEESEDEDEGGYEGQPSLIPPKGKPGSNETLLTAGGGDPRVNRTDVCICPNCGAEVTHPASTSCSDMVCPICGSRLMNPTPGSEESGPIDLQLPTGDIATKIRPISNVTGTFINNVPENIPSNSMQRTSTNLWTLSSKPDDIPPMVGQNVIAVSTELPTTSQVSTCVCPLCGTSVTHPVGIPCSALQCPTCGSRMISSGVQIGGMQTGGMQTGGMQAGGMQTGGMQAGGIQTGGKPDDVPPIQQTYYVTIGGAPSSSGPDSTGPSSAGPAVDGPSMGGGQASSGAAQSGRSTECICPMCNVTVTHPIGVPCSSLTCPICGSRLVNAQPGGTSGGGMQTGGMQTGGKPENMPPVQQTYYIPITSKPDNVPLLGQSGQGGQQVVYIPVTGSPPTDAGAGSGGPAIDISSISGGQMTTPQSGRSTECICPMCNVTVTHPIGVPCSSLTCPICGSRLVNAQPAGASGGAAGMATMQTSYVPVAQSKVVQVSTISKRIVVPSTGRSMNSDIAQLFDKAPYFMMFGLGQYEIIKNPYYRDSRSTGAEVSQYVVGEGGAIIICNNISMTAIRTLKDLQVKVYSGFTGTVQQALDIYSDGRLKDSGTISGIVIDSSTSSEHEGGGPPSSKDKDKKKEKDESSIF